MGRLFCDMGDAFAGDRAPCVHNGPPRMPNDNIVYFELARQALGTTQEGLGKMMGVSRRTAQRWGTSGIPGYALADLARLALPHNRALALKIAAAAGVTLEATRIEPPPPPPAPLPDSVVDAVVCAAAEAMEMMPKEIRPGLHAAFARAKEIGLSVDAIERALRLKLQVAAPPPAQPDPPVTVKRTSPRE